MTIEEKDGKRKTVSMWANEYGVNQRTARFWMRRYGMNPDGTIKLGIRIGAYVKLTEDEWKYLFKNSPSKPGIKKGYTYKK